MKQVLSIGNSFSQDAHHWLPEICKDAGYEARMVNLHISGCSLETHDALLKTEEPLYAYEENGNTINCPMVSSMSILLERNWDIITLQQASHLSGRPQSYFPYLNNMAVSIRKVCPGAKLFLHQTWPYSSSSTHECFSDYNHSRGEMYRRLNDCYSMASQIIDAPLIPVADCFMALSQKMSVFASGKESLLYRDGFHLSSYGRYFSSLIWYSVLFNEDIEKIHFIPPDTDLSIVKPAKSIISSMLEVTN